MFKTILTYLILFFTSLSLYPTNSNALDKLQVGIIAPLTGPAQNMGDSLSKAIRLNQPMNVELFFQDDQCQASRALSAYHLLRSKGVSIFYVACSGPVLALAPLAKRDGTLILSALAGSEKIRSTGPEVIRFNPDSVSIAENMAVELDKIGKRFLLVNEEQDYAESLATILKSKLGAKIVYHDRYRVAEASYRSIITKFRNIESDGLIYIPVSDTSSYLFFKELSELKFPAPIYGDVNVCDQQFKPSDFGMHGVCWRAYGTSNLFEKFTAEFRAAYDRDPMMQYYDGLSNDIIHILSEYAAKNAEVSVAGVKAYILGGVVGKLGKYNFTADGEVINPDEYLSTVRY